MMLEPLILLAVTFLFALVASWALLVPFFEPQKFATGVGGEEDELRDLAERQEIALQALAELETDYLAGKLGQDDYQKSKAELVRDAAFYLEKLASSSKKKGNVPRRS
jgi:hypothetical protein